MNFPESAPEVAYAGLGRRLAAAALDITFFVIVWLVTLSYAIPDAVEEDRALTASEAALVGVLTLAFLTIAFNYFAVGEWRWGRTLGKMTLQIKVTALDGGAVSWNRAVVRNLLLLPDLLLAFFLIPSSERRQRLGDRLAKTVVVRDTSHVVAPVAPSEAPPTTAAPEPAAAAPPAPGGPQVPWGPTRTLAGIAALIVLVVIEAGIVAAFDSDISSLSARLALQAILAATMVGVALAVARSSGSASPAAALGLRRPQRPAVKVAVLAYLVYIGCALLISALLQPEQEDITRDLGFGEGVIGSLAAGLLIVGAAPISEEVFFRGFMFAGIRRAVPFALAAAISAGVWGLFHYTGPGSWGVVLQLAVFGVILAWLYERTGSIWPPIAVHAFNNALAFAILTS